MRSRKTSFKVDCAMPLKNATRSIEFVAEPGASEVKLRYRAKMTLYELYDLMSLLEMVMGWRRVAREISCIDDNGLGIGAPTT
jgi:hypothetical protein